MAEKTIGVWLVHEKLWWAQVKISARTKLRFLHYIFGYIKVVAKHNSTAYVNCLYHTKSFFVNDKTPNNNNDNRHLPLFCVLQVDL